MRIFLTIIFILVCIALTVIVLAQQGKDAGLGAIGGIGDTYWGKNKSRSMEGRLVKFTTLLAVLFIVIAAILNLNF
ncbi:MAG: preprotein translocase subunit SecG [Lachnospiraceae bacterium]|nr:preprotein translocase subunit SecG [Lachnospiraceae bacterium]RKJ50300.1 preprotein translocase subunit SecG [bacterium 1XD42-54]